MDDMDLLQRIRFVFTVAISLMLFAVICGLTLPKKTALVLLERLYDLGKALLLYPPDICPHPLFNTPIIKSQFINRPFFPPPPHGFRLRFLACHGFPPFPLRGLRSSIRWHVVQSLHHRDSLRLPV